MLRFGWNLAPRLIQGRGFQKSRSRKNLKKGWGTFKGYGDGPMPKYGQNQEMLGFSWNLDQSLGFGRGIRKSRSRILKNPLKPIKFKWIPAQNLGRVKRKTPGWENVLKSLIALGKYVPQNGSHGSHRREWVTKWVTKWVTRSRDLMTKRENPRI